MDVLATLLCSNSVYLQTCPCVYGGKACGCSSPVLYLIPRLATSRSTTIACLYKCKCWVWYVCMPVQDLVTQHYQAVQQGTSFEEVGCSILVMCTLQTITHAHIAGVPQMFLRLWLHLGLLVYPTHSNKWMRAFLPLHDSVLAVPCNLCALHHMQRQLIWLAFMPCRCCTCSWLSRQLHEWQACLSVPHAFCRVYSSVQHQPLQLWQCHCQGKHGLNNPVLLQSFTNDCHLASTDN